MEKKCNIYTNGSLQDIQEIIEFLQWVFRKIDKGDTPEETIRMLLMNRAKIDNIVLPDVSNSLPDFRDVIKARIDYFKSIHHTHEAADLQNALNTIIRLVPPINFQIGQ